MSSEQSQPPTVAGSQKRPSPRVIPKSAGAHARRPAVSQSQPRPNVATPEGRGDAPAAEDRAGAPAPPSQAVVAAIAALAGAMVTLVAIFTTGNPTGTAAA